MWIEYKICPFFSVCLIQRYLILQVNVHKGYDFNIDLG